MVLNNKQLLDEVEHDIMNYQNRGLCYLPKPKAEADNTDTRWKRINSKVTAKVSHGLCFKFNTTFLTATIVSDWAKWFDYHNVIERISKKVHEVIKHTCQEEISSW